MGILFLRIGGVDLCLVSSPEAYAGTVPKATLSEIGEVYIHWLNYEVVIACWRVSERRLARREVEESGVGGAKPSGGARDPAPPGDHRGVQEA